MSTEVAATLKRKATDLMKEPLLPQPPNTDNVEFRKSPAEQSGIESLSGDLVVVAQAIHWFEHSGFWKELPRVLEAEWAAGVWGRKHHSGLRIYRSLSPF